MKVKLELEIEQLAEVNTLVKTIDQHRGGALLLLLAALAISAGLVVGYLLLH